jgi:hypothetical protein
VYVYKNACVPLCHTQRVRPCPRCNARAPSQDHHMVDDFFDKITSATDKGAKRDFAQGLIKTLVQHAVAEEMWVRRLQHTIRSLTSRMQCKLWRRAHALCVDGARHRYLRVRAAVPPKLITGAARLSAHLLFVPGSCTP